MISEVEKLVTAGKLSHADGDKLSQLTVGAFCRHKSWGAGRIAEWDLLGDKVVIDFEGKPGHAMKLSFAVGSLDPIPADHLLAKRVGDLAGLQKLAKDSPAELVELALKSNNNTMSLEALEEALIPRVMTAAEYKSWWTAAKKALKTKRHIVVPAKKSEMLVLRDEAESPTQALIDDLLNARDLKGKLAAIARIQKDIDLFKDAGKELEPAFAEINTAAAKSWKLQLKEALNLLLAGEELRELVQAPPQSAGGLSLDELLRQARPQLAEAVNGLPAALLGRVYRAFPAAFPEGAWIQESLAHLTKTGGRAVGEIATVLEANGELDQLAEFLKKAVRNRQLSTDLLIWMCRERKAKAADVFNMDLGNAVLSALEDDHIAGGPKRTGRLSDAFAEDTSLIPELIADADADEVTLFSRRILSTPVFDELTRRSLMGRIIKTRPETQELMGDTSSVDDSLIVSWESIEKRKEELADLVKNKIPQNKKDIQIALGYGDLKENFEYKSARQQQAVLQRMQSKYERELAKAQGTDFANTGTDTVGIGTVVDLEDASTGDRETHSILGAWDGDPDKNILSYLSVMAKALIGKKAGDEAQLPTESGALRLVKINAIRAYRS